MEWIVEHIWGLVSTAAIAFISGFLIGRTLGFSKGRDRVIAKVKGMMIRGKIDFDVEQVLRSGFGSRKQ